MQLGAILKGGLAAGLFINISEFVLNMFVTPPAEGTEGSIAFWVVYAFVLGLFVAYMYALVRPRWGAGPKTAGCAGIMVWLLHTVLPMAGLANMGLMPFNGVGFVWTGVEMAIAGVIAGWLYQEA